MTIKIKPADAAFSKVVRESADWTCQRCGTKYEEGSQGLHCSHIFSRRHRAIRWCKENAQALCFSCHAWFGGNPADSGQWVTELMGQGAIDALRQKKDSKTKVTKKEESLIAKHYRDELKEIKVMRLSGQCGPIDFVSYQ